MRICSGVSACSTNSYSTPSHESDRCGIETERFEIAGEHLHGRDAAGLDRLHELGAGGEREILAAPETKPLGVGEIMHGGRTVAET